MKDSAASSPLMTRRRLLAVGGTVALGGVACYLGWPEGHTDSTTAASDAHQGGHDSVVAKYKALEESEALGEYSRNRFAPHVGSDFQLSASGTVCRLKDVGDIYPCSGPAGDFVSFSLVFSAAVGSPVESSIHTLKHPVLGEFDLFLSPIGPADEQLFLEAICCRRV